MLFMMVVQGVVLYSTSVLEKRENSGYRGISRQTANRRSGDAQAGAISKDEFSLSIFNSAICSAIDEKISDMGQALWSMPSLNGLTIFRSERVVIHVYHQVSKDPDLLLSSNIPQF